MNYKKAFKFVNAKEGENSTDIYEQGAFQDIIVSIEYRRRYITWLPSYVTGKNEHADIIPLYFEHYNTIFLTQVR